MICAISEQNVILCARYMHRCSLTPLFKVERLGTKFMALKQAQVSPLDQRVVTEVLVLQCALG